MVSSQISSGVAQARGTSASARLGQYRQLYTHLLLMRIFKSEMHRPSGVNEWQIPAGAALPMPPLRLARAEPEEEHETSYFALSVNIFNLSASIILRASANLMHCKYIPFFSKSQTFVRIFCRVL